MSAVKTIPLPFPRARLLTAGLTACLFAAPALAAEGVAPPVAAPADALAAQVQRLTQDAAAQTWGNGPKPPRVEVEVGTLDARLKLAPCERIEPYLPRGSRPLGQTRVGLRCTAGPTLWNVYLPVTVKVFAPALVAATALPAGTVLEARHLAEAEVDIAARPDPAITEPRLALGRILSHGLAAGQALRSAHLRARQWFNAGDTVAIVAQGQGWSVAGEGQAIGPGLEGQTARVRTESGRIVQGVATGTKRVELAL